MWGLHIYILGKIITIHKINNKLLNIKESHELKYKKEILTTKDTTIINNEMRNIKYD